MKGHVNLRPWLIAILTVLFTGPVVLVLAVTPAPQLSQKNYLDVYLIDASTGEPVPSMYVAVVLNVDNAGTGLPFWEETDAKGFVSFDFGKFFGNATIDINAQKGFEWTVRTVRVSAGRNAVTIQLPRSPPEPPWQIIELATRIIFLASLTAVYLICKHRSTTHK